MLNTVPWTSRLTRRSRLKSGEYRPIRDDQPMNRYIFHLSIPVSDLASCRRFYVEVLGASIGRANETWLDVLLWGHQITLQHRPNEDLPVERQGKRHFGVILPWNVWREEIARLE